RHMDDAEKEYSEAARLEPGNAAIQLNLATIRLTSTNQNIAQRARVSLQQIATNADFRPAALHQLLTDAIAHKLPEQAVDYSRKQTRQTGVKQIITNWHCNRWPSVH